MHFGPVPTQAAEGAVLAHSVTADATRLRKGRLLGAGDLDALLTAGVEEVTVARMEPGDLGEDAAAEQIAGAILESAGPIGVSMSAPFTGRANLFAEAPGLVRVSAEVVDALNAVDPAITLATVADWSRVHARQMIATVKIIPYGVAGSLVDRAAAAWRDGALRLAPFKPGRASLVLTRTPGFKESLIRKGETAVAARLAALGLSLDAPQTVAHSAEAVAEALRAAQGDLVLVLGASATSDVVDACPAGLVAAGGTLLRFGMPVDPGNLLFLGALEGRPVVGLPGCVRAPALNGADWVLERLAAGIAVTGADIAGMGVGGLLKEIPARPQPRAAAPAASPGRPKVAAIVLAAGEGRRMRGRDKLLEPVGGQPLLRRVAEAALASRADATVVVLPPESELRQRALDGLGARVVVAADCAEGMAASLRAGLAAVMGEVEAVVVLLADMPEIGPREIDRLIAAYDPEEGREICRATTRDGTPGHPVLFGRRFFETLLDLRGDRGARDLLRDAAEDVTDVPMAGGAPLVDLDTPEAWTAWRASMDR